MDRRSACVLCQAPAGLSGLAPDGNRLCRSCDLSWSQADDPDDPARGWDEDYYRDERILQLHRGRESAMNAMVARLSKVSPSRGRLLDVGAGLGFLLRAAARQGWSVEGIEPSRRAVEWARGFTGATVHLGLLEEVPLQPEAYDAITIVDVVRHAPDPLKLLRSARRLLRPGGILVIREIHREAERRYRRLRAKPGGAQPKGPRKVFEYGQRFSPKSLRYALQAIGLRECWVEPSPLFTEAGSGDGHAFPLAKRAIGLASGVFYRISARRIIISPSVLAFGRAPREAPDSPSRSGI